MVVRKSQLNLVITYLNSNIGKTYCHTMPLWHYEKVYIYYSSVNEYKWMNTWMTSMNMNEWNIYATQLYKTI